ncbi:type II toxin-antitoxin system PemK/MazF family toxin [Candidatus Saccharibacteria bacterium]|nr:type II toxin-antitoxin system PemK/MazF family toxin [Candidatus Saccharibacteria bacterium]
MGKDDFLEKRDYKEWMPIKADTHNAGRYRTFSEGQIWWCIWGENVGTEINGKGELFLRPVYIFKKDGRLNFTGIPLTTQAHEGHGYVKFNFKDKEIYAVLSQIRATSVFRLLRKKGEADDMDVSKIKNAFAEYFDLREKNSSGV